LDGSDLPAFSGGAHTVVEMDDHGTRRLNPYSLMSDPADRSGYEISVRRDDAGRGGSFYMHRHVRVGMEMTLSYPVNLFPLDTRAKKHLMIAGGIGITPFLAQIAQLRQFGGRFELHYAARSRSLGAYMDRLTERASGPGALLLRRRRPDHRPSARAGDAADRHASLRLRSQGHDQLGPVHRRRHGLAEAGAAFHEEFLAPGTGLPFEVQLAASGLKVTVGTTQSLLEAIEAAGVDAPYLCRGGACGQCETNVHQCDGTILHRDHWLTPEEQALNTKIMPCVSRFEGRTLVIDR
jgi:dimethylamine monooxygenase subunit B